MADTLDSPDRERSAKNEMERCGRIAIYATLSVVGAAVLYFLAVAVLALSRAG